MSFFWKELESRGNEVAVIDAETGYQITYRNLNAQVDRLAEHLWRPRKMLVFLQLLRSLDGIIGYLAFLRAGHSIFLAGDSFRSDYFNKMINTFQPEFLYLPSRHISELSDRAWRTEELGKFVICERRSEGFPIHPDLSLVVPTSGSSRSPKFVRLSYTNLASAAAQACSALDVASHDRAISILPFTHIYGLSVLNSHLDGGAAVVVSGRSILDKRLWQHFNRYKVTTLSGVPWTYDILRRGEYTRRLYPSVTKLSQSGGTLDVQSKRWLRELYPSGCGRLYFMYGQTEASGRMTVLPPEEAYNDLESVGYAVTGASVSVEKNEEIVFWGPNVMLGYARNKKDLMLGDCVEGRLLSGDRGKLDHRGRLHVLGRLDRTCKILGIRVDLDELEAEFDDICVVAATASNGAVAIYAESDWGSEVSARAAIVAEQMGLPVGVFRVSIVGTLPRLGSGKLNYSMLSSGSLGAENE